MKSSEKKSDQIAVLLDDAERAESKTEPKTAEEALREAGKLLADPELQLSPDREIYAGRHAELLQKLNEVREARLAKDIEEAVRSERAEIGPSLQAVKDASEALAGGKVTEKLVAAAQDAVATLDKAVSASDDRRVFALKDSSFVGYLKRAKGEAAKARAEAVRAEKKLRFLAGPVALKLKAAAELKQSRSEKELEQKRSLTTAAAEDYGRCLSTGTEFVKGGFGGEKLAIEGATLSIEAFLETCRAEQKSAEQALQKLPKPKAAPAKKKQK